MTAGFVLHFHASLLRPSSQEQPRSERLRCVHGPQPADGGTYSWASRPLLTAAQGG